MNKLLASSALAIAASVSVNAFAQSNEEPVTQLEPIIVSAGISPVAADQYGRSYTVITRRDIEERGYATVQQALEAQPGISMSGDAPNNRQIRIRGGEANHTLVLIDGVRAAAGEGEYYLRGLDTGVIERIEILRGPQSVPYGTDASAGVVNIITRQARSNFDGGGFAEFGEGDRQSAYLTYGGAQGNFSLTASNSYDEGFDFSGSEGEKDSTSSEVITSKAELTIASGWNVGFAGRFAQTSYEFDDYDGSVTTEEAYVIDDATKSTDRTERLGRLQLENLVGSFAQRLSFERTANQTDGEFENDALTEILAYRTQFALDGGSVSSTDELLSLLLERKEDSIESAGTDREADSLATEYVGRLGGGWNLQLGIRYDDNSKFGSATTWNAATSYSLGRGSRLHASVGRGVVNPTFYEIYVGGTENQNPDLTPEKNVGFDVGYEFAVGKKGYVDVTYFQETLTDEITSDDFVEFYNEEGDSDRRGVELSGEYELLNRISTGFQYTYLDAEGPNGSTETRRPRHEFGLTADYESKATSTIFGAQFRYVRGLYDDQFWTGGQSGARLENFMLADFSFKQPLSENIDLIARVTNAFDEEYKEVWAYATRGRAGYFGVRASW